MLPSFRRAATTDASFAALWQEKVTGPYPDLSVGSLDTLARLNSDIPGFFVEGTDGSGATILMAYVNVMRVVGFLGLSYTVVSIGTPQSQGKAMWLDQSMSSHNTVLPAFAAFLRRESPHSIFISPEFDYDSDLELLAFYKKNQGYSVIFCGERSQVDLDGFSNYDQYLNTLEKKDRWFAKKVEKIAAEQNVELIVTDDYESHIDRLYELYLSVHNRATELVYPPQDKEFFLLSCRDKVPGRTALLAMRRDVLVGFCLLSENDNLLSCGFCGIDHTVVKEINTWYLLMLNAIRRAVETRKQRIILGTTNFSMKKKLGAHKSDLYLAIGFPNPVMRLFFQGILRNAFYKIYAVRDKNGLEH